MTKSANFSSMTIAGWQKKYSAILREFDYSKKNDLRSAKILNSFLHQNFPLQSLKKNILNKTIFVVGAGPSLTYSLPILKKYKNITKIVADGAIKPLIENKIIPEIVVTDLDGDLKSLKKVGKTNSLMIVHAHGDNIDKLNLVCGFKNCLGTTETKPFNKIQNFGGFTDGDRCVFLANHFKAKNIILFGMDFGPEIGIHSKPKILNKTIKLRKLRRGKKLLEWLATKRNSKLYTTSKPIKGFKKIQYRDLKKIILS